MQEGGQAVQPEDVMRWNLGPTFIQFLLREGAVSQDGLISAVHQAVRAGHAGLAATWIQTDVTRGGSAFSKYFIQALTGTGDPWGGAAREVSARKKSEWEQRQFTPLHCAAINPDPGPLAALLHCCPDTALADADRRKVVHYAAACSGPGPLQLLAERGANLEDTDRTGRTPLMIACQTGRLLPATFLLDRLADRPAEQFSAGKFGRGGVDRPDRDSWCPLHIAVVEQQHAVAELLLQRGAAVNKPLNTKLDKEG